jgi:hypothetical protein
MGCICYMNMCGVCIYIVYMVCICVMSVHTAFTHMCTDICGL